jgi:hypothetical protein
MTRTRIATLSPREAVCDRALDQAAGEPELRLMLAVLEDAVVTLQHGADSPSPSRRRRYFEAGCWIDSRDVDSPFSFENVCAALHLDAAYVREGVAAMKLDHSVRAFRVPRRRVRRGWRDDVGASRRVLFRASGE